MHWGPTHVISSIYVLKNRVWSLKLSHYYFISNAINHHTVNKNKPQGLYFSKALFEGFIFGGAYVWREICISKLIGLVLFLEGNLPFFLFYFVFEGNFQVQAPGGGRGGGLYLEGLFNSGYFAFTYEFGGLKFGGAYTFQNFTVFNNIVNYFIMSTLFLAYHTMSQY